MLHRIEVDIQDAAPQIGFTLNLFPFKILDKQRTAALIDFIKRLRIAAEEIRKLFADEIRINLFQSLKLWKR